MAITDMMLDIIKWGESLKERSVTRETFTQEKEKFIERKSHLKLARDRIAVSNLYLVISKRLFNTQLVLAYEYEGQLYSVAKDHRTNAPQGILSVELLLQKGLTCSDFDKMKKVDIWVHSGKRF